MIKKPDIVCIGSVLWDIIGRSSAKMNLAADRPGKIIRIPGGVALNLAMSLQKKWVQFINIKRDWERSRG